MSVLEICSRAVAIVSPNESVREAARRMTRLVVGTLVVVSPEEDDRPIGLITDRDIVTRCVGAGLDPDETPVRRGMSAPALAVPASASIEEAVRLMSHEGVRRLVITDALGRLMGVLSLDDVMEHLARESEQVAGLAPTIRKHGASTRGALATRRPRERGHAGVPRARPQGRAGRNGGG